MWGRLKSWFIAFQRHWNTVDWLTFKAPPLITRDIVVAKIASPGSIWVSKHLTREHLMAGMVLASKGFWQGGEATLFHTCLLNIIICIFKISSLCMILSSPSFVITTFETHIPREFPAHGGARTEKTILFNEQNKKCECNPQSIVFRWLAFLYATEYSYHVYVHVNLSLSCRNKANQLFNVFILLQINSKIQN